MGQFGAVSDHRGDRSWDTWGAPAAPPAPAASQGVASASLPILLHNSQPTWVSRPSAG